MRYWPDGATTYSLVMRSRSGTLRWVEAEHRFEKLEGISGVDYHERPDPEPGSSWAILAPSIEGEAAMAEKTVVVCDVCGDPRRRP